MSNTAQATRQADFVNNTMLCEPILCQVNNGQAKSCRFIQTKLHQQQSFLFHHSERVWMIRNGKPKILSENPLTHQYLQKIWRLKIFMEINRILCCFTAEVDPNFLPICTKNKLRIPIDTMRFIPNETRCCDLIMLCNLKHAHLITPTMMRATIPCDTINAVMRASLIPANNELEKFFLGKCVLYRKSCRKDQHGFIASSL